GTGVGGDEMRGEVRLPVPPAYAGCAVEEFARRRGDFAIAAVTVLIERVGERCSKARLATAGVGPVSIRLTSAERILEQDGLSDSVIEKAAVQAAAQVSPQTDQQGTAEYRRHLTRVLTARALRRARAVH